MLYCNITLPRMLLYKIYHSILLAIEFTWYPIHPVINSSAELLNLQPIYVQLSDQLNWAKSYTAKQNYIFPMLANALILFTGLAIENSL